MQILDFEIASSSYRTAMINEIDKLLGKTIDNFQNLIVSQGFRQESPSAYDIYGIYIVEPIYEPRTHEQPAPPMTLRMVAL